MNRKQYRSWLLTTLLAISSATVVPTAARAQQIGGSFTLPYTVHWGLATLSPGKYTLARGSASDPSILSVYRPGSTVMIMAQDQRTLTGNRNVLHILRVGNEATVSSLDLAFCGVSFQFANHLPRQIQMKQASNGPSNKASGAITQAAVIDVPITVSGQ